MEACDKPLSFSRLVQLTCYKIKTSVLSSVREGDFMASVDLMDASFQIPIHKESRKYLRFVLREVAF